MEKEKVYTPEKIFEMYDQLLAREGHAEEKILVAEDVDAARKMFAKSIRKMGFAALEAKDGDQVIQILSKDSPRLVLLDLRLPRKDGYEILEWMQKADKIKDIPVIVCSVQNNKQDIVKCIKMGVKAYIIKPVNYDNLKANIYKALNITEEKMDNGSDKEKIDSLIEESMENSERDS